MAGAKVLLMANGNDATLGALLSTLNISALLLSTYLTSFPLLLIALPGAFLVYKYGVRGDSAAVEGRRRHGLMMLPLVGVSFLLTPTSVDYLLQQFAVAAVFLMLAFSRLFLEVAEWPLPQMGPLDLNALKSWLAKHMEVVAVAYVTFVLVAAPLLVNPLREMWLPAAKIEVEGYGAGTGWILAEDDHTTQILWADSTVVRFPSAQLKKVEFCRRGQSGGRVEGRPLVLVLFSRNPGKQLDCP
ncbi:hypothetical protein ACQP1S_28560 [Micromonospora matsumotoense]|uniref:hypothetical protein n=1 Tax=Micromonospora matsumotoense TaxID=121616 RepID=UPI003D8DC0A6